ncbi:hypothetical protein Fmac_014114 [Flemingia macrophylla]|uniref:Uncharacterized protein n=1 Tax=Flemingia macrophylla TaxID=520843 RepID=A0ABD1MAT8_9FABA
MRNNDIGAAFVYQPCIYVALHNITVGNKEFVFKLNLDVLADVLFILPSFSLFGMAMTHSLVRTRMRLVISPNIITPFAMCFEGARPPRIKYIVESVKGLN